MHGSSPEPRDPEPRAPSPSPKGTLLKFRVGRTTREWFNRAGANLPPAPAPKVETVVYEFPMQRRVKTMFSEHVMCALFCVTLRAARVEKQN